MELAGMQAWTDAIGNVHGEIMGPAALDGAIVLGSHYDTVRDAGAYDGTLGIVTAIAAVKAMVLSSSMASSIRSVNGARFTVRTAVLMPRQRCDLSRSCGTLAMSAGMCSTAARAVPHAL